MGFQRRRALEFFAEKERRSSIKDILQMDLLVATFPTSNLMDRNTSTASGPNKGELCILQARSPWL
jgi:hypothetical protein